MCALNSALSASREKQRWRLWQEEKEAAEELRLWQNRQKRAYILKLLEKNRCPAALLEVTASYMLLCSCCGEEDQAWKCAHLPFASGA